MQSGSSTSVFVDNNNIRVDSNTYQCFMEQSQCDGTDFRNSRSLGCCDSMSCTRINDDWSECRHNEKEYGNGRKLEENGNEKLKTKRNKNKKNKTKKNTNTGGTVNVDQDNGNVDVDNE